MKKLGVAPSPANEGNQSMMINWLLPIYLSIGDEWEAELEGELNEYEVVKEEDNPEWESQIQEMLEAEDESDGRKKWWISKEA